MARVFEVHTGICQIILHFVFKMHFKKYLLHYNTAPSSPAATLCTSAAIMQYNTIFI